VTYWVTQMMLRGHGRRAAALPGGVPQRPLRRLALQQWLALTPPELVAAHLHLDDAVVRSLSARDRPVVR
jgi:hypothetical protein